MARVANSKLVKLQQTPKIVRHVCVLAHVDHGKTTIVDLLLATNSIISSKMAGKLRYLDDREDEQRRGITMKSSVVGLYFSPVEMPRNEYLINLIDTPGHIDFSSEVLSATRICDGALIVVDVVEGVCSQTLSSLEVAYSEKTNMILVLNKIDRLILEKLLTPNEIYIQLTKVIETVNATVAEIKFRDYSLRVETDLVYEETDTDGYFKPETNNVVFGSAVDGWAFRLHEFAVFYKNIFNMSVEDLTKNLWKDVYYDKKRKVMVPEARAANKKPLFVTSILNNICALYDNFVVFRDPDKVEQMIKTLAITKTRDMASNVPRLQLHAVMSKWLPMSEAILCSIVEIVPSPVSISPEKVHHILRRDNLNVEQDKLATLIEPNISTCSYSANSPVIAYIAKFVSIDKSNVIRSRYNKIPTVLDIAAKRQAVANRKAEINKQGQAAAEMHDKDVINVEVVKADDEVNKENEFSEKTEMFNKIRLVKIETLLENGAQCEHALKVSKNVTINTEDIITIEDSPKSEDIIQGSPEKSDTKSEVSIIDNSKIELIALVRIFSGVLKPGGKLYLLSPTYAYGQLQKDNASHDESLNVVKQIQIDDLFILQGRDVIPIEGAIAGNIIGISNLTKYMVRTGTITSTLDCISLIENSIPMEPFYRTAIEPRHPNDLQEIRDAIKFLMQSDPSVQCVIQENGECVLLTAGDVHLEKCLEDIKRFTNLTFDISVPMVRLRETLLLQKSDFSKSINGTNEEIGLSFTLTAYPMPLEIEKIISKHFDLLKTIEFTEGQDTVDDFKHIPNFENPKIFKNVLLKQAAYNAKTELNDKFKSIGLIWENAANKIISVGNTKYDSCILMNFTSNYRERTLWNVSDPKDIRTFYDRLLISGFQNAIQTGPICDEPLKNILFCLLSFQLDTEMATSSYNSVSGSVITQVKNVCHEALNKTSVRLMEPMYRTSLNVDTSIMGKLTKSLAKRGGRINHSSLYTPGVFKITAILPVIGSFEFAHEVRTATGGKANPCMEFSHYEVIDTSPYEVQVVDDEENDLHNRAHKLMNEVRRRKGLSVDEKIVVHGEKQRTLNKKK